MTRVLVTYFSVTGNNNPSTQLTNYHLLATDYIIFCSPTYFGQMAPEVKRMFDVTEKIYGKLEGKVGGAFTSAGGAGCGHETTIMSIIIAMMVSGMVIQGTTKGPHYGPFAVGQPNEMNLAQAENLGVRVAKLAQKLSG
jgi:NAD(P)H dehydrogenase (quinone)